MPFSNSIILGFIEFLAISLSGYFVLINKFLRLEQTNLNKRISMFYYKNINSK
ncbi:hypothetical protein KKG81_10085 [bacterium]|jgi:undecaprenyl pyrophosphate phosphatase UppP|nr:hypothetical protein [bacterium]